MGKMVKIATVGLLVLGIILALNGTIIYAAVHATDEEPIIESYIMTATAYCIDGTTATGTHTRSGICASKREWFGKRVAIYTADEEGKASQLIGYYVVEDTGGRPIRKGKVIDIWMPTEDECFAFGHKKVVVFLID